MVVIESTLAGACVVVVMTFVDSSVLGEVFVVVVVVVVDSARSPLEAGSLGVVVGASVVLVVVVGVVVIVVVVGSLVVVELGGVTPGVELAVELVGLLAAGSVISFGVNTAEVATCSRSLIIVLLLSARPVAGAGAGGFVPACWKPVMIK